MPSVSTPPHEGCPYLDGDCPKVEEVKSEVKSLADDVGEIKRISYIICGILIAYLGVTIL